MAFNPPSTSSGSGSTPPSAPADTQAPSIRILSPTADTFVSGNVSVSFSATDNVAVTRVELLINGVVAKDSSSAPFSIKWNTVKVSKGTYILQGRAYDAKGNSALSSSFTVYR